MFFLGFLLCYRQKGHSWKLSVDEALGFHAIHENRGGPVEERFRIKNI